MKCSNDRRRSDERNSNNYTQSTSVHAQPCILPGTLNPSTSFGWRESGNVISAGWQATLCDLIWHASFRSKKTFKLAHWTEKYIPPFNGPFSGTTRVSRMPFLPPNQQCQSTEGLDRKVMERQKKMLHYTHTHTRLTALCPGLSG